MIGVVSGGAQMMMTLGYRFAPAAIVAPFDYSERAWRALLGFVQWGDVPTAWVVGVPPLVIGSGTYIMCRAPTPLRLRWPSMSETRHPPAAPPEPQPTPP